MLLIAFPIYTFIHLYNFQTDYLTIYLSFNQHIKLLLSSLKVH